uniref:SWIM-type domain-containing protein n=1 Tax=Fagus sylvatica TaxID=28930 RepID=A0A2N9ILE3_FAGSY
MDDDEFFLFEIHFGGRFKNLNELVYVNSDVTAHDEPFDSDCLSIFELESILGKYGYQHGDLIYYKLTDMSLNNGLVLLKTDADVLKMVDAHKTEKFVILYTISATDVDDCIPLTPTLLEVLVVDKSKGKGKGKGKESGTSNKRDKLPIIGGKNKNKGIKITDRQPPVKGKEKKVADRSKGKGKEKIFEKEYDADDDVDCADFDNGNEARLEVEDDGFELDFWDGLLSSDEDLLDAAVDAYSQRMTTEIREPENEKDWDSEMPNSDELITPLATSDEENVPKGPRPKSVEFDVIDMSNPVLENGMKFADVYQFREAVRKYNLKIGKDLSFVKNDKDKVIIVCKDEHCNYRVYGSQVRDEMTFQIKTYNPNHTYTRAYKNSAMNSKWISKRYMETFRHDIKKPTIALQQEIKGTWHAEGSYKGHLLSAVSRDANDNMYPICVAVVESECKASWSWFLSTLLKDIGEVVGGWTFISDRQKGLTESFKDVCPDMDPYTEFEFDAHMAELKKLSPPAYEYLSKIPVATWSRSKFTKNPKSDLIVNNLSECFNSYILDARDKPILTMLDTIRRKLMKRFQVNRASIAKMSGKLCPNIQVKVEKAGFKASECLLMYSGEGKYEVDYIQQKFVMNLREKSCGCKKWDITGIPCHHAISAILYQRGKIEDYVDLCYTIEKYKKSYKPIIHPVPSMKQWTRTQYDPIDPPLERCHPGRPKRMRRRDPYEPSNPYKFSKVGTNIKCSSCKKLGHNSRTCPLAKKQKSKTSSKGKKKSGDVAAAGTAAAAGGARGAAGAETASGSAGTAGRGAASKKAKVVVVPTVEKDMTRIVVKKQKKQ